MGVAEGQTRAANAQIRRLQGQLDRCDPAEAMAAEAAADEVARLRRENQLLTTSASAMENVLRLQESTLGSALGHNDDDAAAAAAGDADAGTSTDGGAPPSAAWTLLTRWREKVYALMVQQAGSDHSHAAAARQLKEAARQLHGQVVAAERELADKAVENGILRSSCDSRDAQLELQKGALATTQAALAAARAAACDAERRATAKHDEAARMAAAVKTASVHFAERLDAVNETAGQQELLLRRLEFAAQRTETIKYFLSLQRGPDGRGDSGAAAATAAAAECTESCDDADVVTGPGGSHAQEELHTLRAEVRQLQREKEFLVGKTQQDGLSFGARVAAAKASVEAELAAAVSSAAEGTRAAKLAAADRETADLALQETREAAALALHEIRYAWLGLVCPKAHFTHSP